MPVHPYLSFGGNCRQAFERYHQIFGGQMEIMPFSDAPEGEAPPDHGDWVMHAYLNNDDVLLMASDVPEGFDGVKGMHVNYPAPSLEEAQRVFDALADGGTVDMPLEPTFWSPGFGMVTDAFGVPWMVNVEAGEGGPDHG